MSSSTKNTVKNTVLPIQLDDTQSSQNTLKFTLSNIDCSIANAIRRTIGSDIETYCMDTVSNKGANITINTNTCRINSEILKQRLACIPIHITDENFPTEKYEVVVDEQNNTNELKLITTEHFKIRDIENNKYLDMADTQQIFPPNSTTKHYILFTRLRPQIGDVDGESIKFKCKISKKNVKDNSSFNVVSTCVYGQTVDEDKAAEVWTQKKAEYTKQSKTEEDMIGLENDFMTLDKQRIVIPNSYDYTIESTGVYTPTVLVQKACDIIIQGLGNISTLIGTDDLKIIPSNIVNKNAYDIYFSNESYIKSIEYSLYTLLHEQSNSISFSGFKMKHPHDDFVIIRLIYNTDTNIDIIKRDINKSIADLISTYTKIRGLFTDKSTS